MTFDPLVEERVSPTVSVQRSDNGNPMIVPRDCAEAVEYTRASGMADFLVKDIFGIKKWEMRYLAQALGRHPDLAAEAAVQYYSTGPFSGTQPLSARKAAGAALDDIIERALERERIHEAANAGTAVHKATEPGAPNTVLPSLLAGSVREYQKLTAGFERVASEVFVVNDEIKSGGTFDSAYITPEYPGFIVVGDTKSGKNYHQAEFEIQLAIYSRGEVYLGDPIDDVDQRLTFEEYFGLPVNQDVGYLVHVPLEGKPKPRVIKLDLQRGWRRAQLCAQIRDERVAFDKTGVGEKVDCLGLAAEQLDEKLQELLDWFDGEYRDLQSMQHQHDVEERFRLESKALYRRFSHCWQESHTLLVKGRLS